LNERRQLLSEIEGKKKAVYDISCRHHDQRIIVFSESIRSIEALRVYLAERGVMAETYHSGKNELERNMIFDEWGRKFNVLLCVRALDEGVDVPEVGIAVIIASGQSVRQLVQRKGRIMRPKEGKQAQLYIVYARGSIEFYLIHKIKGILKGLIRLY